MKNNMSTIKSYSVGNGDMFYINHDSDNFTIIDCCLNDNNRDQILKEIKELGHKKSIIRFISTHPDEDHIKGLELLYEHIGIPNFYCVENNATKSDETESFNKYCELRNNKEKAFYMSYRCSRRWINLADKERESSCINILWPKTENEEFKKALKEAEKEGSPNNISSIIEYSSPGGVRALWMGDMETEFMSSIEVELLDILTEIDILFAPHHGRNTGRVPGKILKKLNPKIIVIGEGNSEDLNYYKGYNTITQNSAGDIIFECEKGKIHVYTSNKYDVDFLKYELGRYKKNYNYLGTLLL